MNICVDFISVNCFILIAPKILVVTKRNRTEQNINIFRLKWKTLKSSVGNGRP